MALRPDIIMAGRQPNMVNVLANSAQAAGMQNEVVKQNRLAQLYNEQGPAIMSGDKNALNAYAKISPEAALGVQGARMDMDVQSASLEQLRFQTKTAMEELVRTRGLQEAAQIAAERARVVKAALAAPDQQSLDTYLAQNGMEEWIGTITTENRDMYASEFIESMSDVIETFGPKAPEDRKYAEDAQGLKRYVDTGELVFPNDVPKPMQRPTQKAADGYLYYLDGEKERVFPKAQLKEDAPLVQILGGNKLDEQIADTLTNEDRAKAEAAQTVISTIDDGMRLLDEGIISGAGAAYKVQAIKFARALGIDVPNDVSSNTEAFNAVMGRAVAQIIKEFGAGTGLSDADREYAQKIVGGEIRLDEKAIRRIFDLGRKAATGRIQSYNDRVDAVLKGDREKALKIEMPPAYEAPTTTTTPPPASDAGSGSPAIDQMEQDLRQEFGGYFAD